MESLAQFIAQNRNTKKKFSSLHAEWLQQNRETMSTPTTSTLNSTQTLSQTGNGLPVAEAQKLAVKLSPGNASTSTMGVSTQLPQPAATPVDSKTLEGSYAGDHRAPANSRDLTAFAKDAPGPREPVRQSAVMSSKLTAGPAPVSDTGESLADQS